MLHSHFPTTTLIFTVFTSLLLLPLSSTTDNHRHRHRRLLHQPLFPLDQSLPPTTTISQPPFSSPSPQHQPQEPKYPFSTLTPPDATAQNPFFPFFPSPPPPPPPTATSATVFATFPANISSLVLPSSSHSSHKPIKLISLIVSVSIFSIIVLASLVVLLLRHLRHDNEPLKTDSLRLFPPDTTPSDTTTTATTDSSKKPPPPLFPRHIPSSTSSEFLYLGTLVSSRDPDYVGPTAATLNDANKVPPPPPPPAAAPVSYQRLGSPELQPLPPLPRQHSHQNHHLNGEGDNHEEEEEEFFSPRGSTANNASPYCAKSSPPLNAFGNNNGNHELNKSRSLNALNCNSSAYSVSPDNSPSVVLNTGSPQSILSRSPDSLVNFSAPLPRFIPPPRPQEEQRRAFLAFSPSSTEDCSPRASDFGKVPPPPPPPPARLWEAAPPTGPPELVAPSRKVVSGEKGGLRNSSGEIMKPKLKPLHWDKVRASSDRAMVWDQLKSSSFQ